MGKPAIEGGAPVRNELLSFSPPDIGNEEISAAIEVLQSGWITTGPRCRDFEDALCAYTGASHAVLLSSATAGLFLCLKLLEIGIGDEVITTPYTFAATANVIIHTGARPVFADINEDTFNISPSEIEKRITPHTKAVIPVHYAGHPAAMDEIHEIAEEYDLPVDSGVGVGRVQDGSPADRAGLMAGDIIVEAAGDQIKNSGDLLRVLTEYRAGETVTVGYYRDGDLEEAEVTLG